VAPAPLASSGTHVPPSRPCFVLLRRPGCLQNAQSTPSAANSGSRGGAAGAVRPAERHDRLKPGAQGGNASPWLEAVPTCEPGGGSVTSNVRTALWFQPPSCCARRRDSSPVFFLTRGETVPISIDGVQRLSRLPPRTGGPGAHGGQDPWPWLALEVSAGALVQEKRTCFHVLPTCVLRSKDS